MCFFNAVFLLHLDISPPAQLSSVHTFSSSHKHEKHEVHEQLNIACSHLRLFHQMRNIIFFGQALAHVHRGRRLPNLSAGPIFLQEFLSFLSTVFSLHPDSSRCSNGPSDCVHHHHLNTHIIVIHYMHFSASSKWSPKGNICKPKRNISSLSN